VPLPRGAFLSEIRALAPTFFFLFFLRRGCGFPILARAALLPFFFSLRFRRPVQFFRRLSLTAKLVSVYSVLFLSRFSSLVSQRSSSWRYPFLPFAFCGRTHRLHIPHPPGSWLPSLQPSPPSEAQVISPLPMKYFVSLLLLCFSPGRSPVKIPWLRTLSLSSLANRSTYHTVASLASKTIDVSTLFALALRWSLNSTELERMRCPSFKDR